VIEPAWVSTEVFKHRQVEEATLAYDSWFQQTVPLGAGSTISTGSQLKFFLTEGGHLGGSEHRNPAKKFGKYRNTAEKNR